MGNDKKIRHTFYKNSNHFNIQSDLRAIIVKKKHKKITRHDFFSINIFLIAIAIDGAFP